MNDSSETGHVAGPTTGLVSAGSREVDTKVLVTAGLAAVVVGIIGVALGAVFAGTQGVIGAVIATVIVLIFFSVGQFALGSVLRTNPDMAMTVALMVYLIKIGALFILIIVFAHTTFFNTKVFAATIVACTIAWTASEVWVFSRTKVLYVDPKKLP